MEQSAQHKKYLDAWIEQHAHGLTNQSLIFLFEQALQAIQKRTAITLSDVTMTAILERAIHQSRKKFPLLSGISIDPDGISLKELAAKSADFTPMQLTEGIGFLMVELFTILGNLTAGILTKPLYEELTRISATIRPDLQNRSRRLKSLGSADREDE